MTARTDSGAAFDLAGAYVHLEAGGGAVTEEVGADFWQTLATRDYAGRRLVGVFHMTDDPPAWEMHPAGEEVLLLLSGAIGVVLQEADGERVVELRPRNACIVPRGVWHRQLVRMPSDLLAITPGAGTQHRPV